jgi:WD40 repeat protein
MISDPGSSNDGSISEREAYAIRALPAHLAVAKRFNSLKELLLNGHFLREKLFRHGPQMVIDDYDLLRLADVQGSTTPIEVQEALRQSSHILAADVNQLAPQLFARLPRGRSTDVDQLLDQTRPSVPWLRPLLPSLSEGNRLFRTLRHGGPVYGMAVMRSAQMIATGSYSLKVWDLGTGIEKFELPCAGGLIVEVLEFDNPREGPRLVSVDQNGKVGIFDFQTGARKGALEALGGVKAAAMTSDGRYLITAPDAWYAEVWDTRTSALICKLEDPKAPQVWVSWQMAEAGFWEWDGRGHRKRITCIAISQDDRRVYTGSDDKQVIAWKIPEGKVEWQRWCPAGVRAIIEVHRGTIIYVLENGEIFGQRGLGFEEDFLVGHHDKAQSLATTPDGDLLASGARDGSIKLWDLKHFCLIESLTGDTVRRSDAILHCGVTKLDFVRGSRQLVSATEDGLIKLWRLPDMGNDASDLAKNEAGVVRSIRARSHLTSKAGWTLLGASREGITIMDLHNGDTRVYATACEHDEVNVFAMTPDGQTFAAGCKDGKLMIGHSGGNDLNVISLGKDPVSAIAITADGHRVVAGTGARGSVAIVDICGWTIIRKVHLDCPNIDKMALSIDEGMLFCASSEHSMFLAWEINDGTTAQVMKEVGRGRPPAGVSLLQTSAGTEGVFFVHYSQDITSIGRWNPGNARESFQLELRGGHRYALSNSGKWAAVETRSHCVQLLDLVNRRRSCLLEGHHQYLTGIGFTADSSQVVTCSADGRAGIWNLDGTVHQKFETRGAAIEGVIPTPDGAALICGDERGLLELWDVGKGDRVASFLVDAPIQPRHITPDGRTIVATDATGGIHLLSVENYRTTAERAVVAAAPARKPILIPGWQWRFHEKRGRTASERRDWRAAELEYRTAAAFAEMLPSDDKLNNTLDSLEFVVGMKKNDEILSIARTK